jgi:hypothetical protein
VTLAGAHNPSRHLPIRPPPLPALSAGPFPFQLLTACVRWFEQYPGEKEITFPPFTCLEADGQPRVEESDKGGVIVFPLRVLPSLLCWFK